MTPRYPRTFAAACLLIALAFFAPARAGGPLRLGGSAGTTPILYGATEGLLTLHLDSDNLNQYFTNAESDAIIGDAAAAWNGIGTSTVYLALGPDLSPAITAGNFDTASENQIVDHGRSHVIYDRTGEIIDLLYGDGAKSNIIGLGASYYNAGGTEFIGGYLILNGWIELSPTAYLGTAMHEIGHVMGLDHTQLDDTQGLPSNQYPIMYPLANVNDPQTVWHEDDVSTISRLYPSSIFHSAYVLIQGKFVDGSGNAVRGANIWVEEVTTGELYASVSDFLTAGDGYFLMAVPPGRYTLHAEAIQSNFTGGSSVGPYAEHSGDVSFQTPISQQPARDGSLVELELTPSSACYPRVTFVLDGTSSWTCNEAPLTGNVAIHPSAPTDDDDLVLSYGFNDGEGDAESGTLYRWYRDGNHAPVFDGETHVPASSTTVGEAWQAEVTPSDGTGLGDAVRSSAVVIGEEDGDISGGIELDGSEGAARSLRRQGLSGDDATRCGCATAGGSGGLSGDGVAVLLALLWVRRRRG